MCSQPDLDRRTVDDHREPLARYAARRRAREWPLSPSYTITRDTTPDEGRILLDGHDLRNYDLDDLRGNMSVIFQDFVRYNLSAADNIAVGRIDAREDRSRIEEAAGKSLADDVIARLPAGYDQMVGKRFKNGVELSGGEWQKIAIARAYMRDAQVLIRRPRLRASTREVFPP